MLRRFGIYSKIVKNARPEPPKAEDIMKSSDIISIRENYTKCSGNGLVGHPAIFINLVQINFIDNNRKTKLYTRVCIVDKNTRNYIRLYLSPFQDTSYIDVKTLFCLDSDKLKSKILVETIISINELSVDWRLIRR